MGLKTVTDGKAVTVYRKDRDTQNGGKFTTYCIGIASKDKEGNWVNGFLDCQFKKGVEVNNKAKIEIANSFYTVNEYNGKKYTKLFILDFTVTEDGEAPVSQEEIDMSFMDISADMQEELPFA